MSIVYRRSFAGVVAICLVLGIGVVQADDDHDAAADKAWLRDYLAKTMNYNEDQIEYFTDTVAEMSRGEMIALIDKLKLRQAFGGVQREISLTAHRHSLERIAAEKSHARKQSSKPSFHSYTKPARKRRPSPSRRGLYRGSFVIIRVD